MATPHTAYLAAQSLGKSLAPYLGGICKWYYVPIQGIQTFASINAETQQLTAAPTLKPGYSWYGPVNVPDRQLGLQEEQDRNAPGIFYKRKITGAIPGSDVNSHINTANMAYHQYCVVAKVRAGGYWIVFGDDEQGMEFDHAFASGQGNNEAGGSNFALVDECVHKSLVLPSFDGIESIAPPTGGGSGSGGTGSDGSNETEIIAFTTTNISPTVTVTWTGARNTRFGSFPTIEVWYLDGSTYRLDTAAIITCDAAAPAQTAFTIDRTGADQGFIILK